jgi:hypothetical protein
VTLATLLQPGWIVVLLVWNFAVLTAAQLTIRLIMAFSIRLTLVATVVVTLLDIVVAGIYDVALGQNPTLGARLELVPLAMVLMAVAGFATARWVLRIKRLRGQIIAGLMVGLLDPHLFTLLSA